MIDLTGDGIIMSPPEMGIRFDISGTGFKSLVAWTYPGINEGFVVLDRNGDGIINDGTEMFGNFTPQPASDQPNGFAALAQFDDPANGGNGNGLIDPGDAVFSKLRIWVDYNHDGISQPAELHTLAELNIGSIDLNYKEDRKKDQWGNQFRFRAKINSADHTDKGSIGRWAVDVFLMAIPDPLKETQPQ